MLRQMVFNNDLKKIKKVFAFLTMIFMKTYSNLVKVITNSFVINLKSNFDIH